MDRYRNFAALQEGEALDEDYRIRVALREPSRLAVVAPHGGSIERRTSAIATAIAGNEFNFYAFEGLDPDGSFDSLHITSHRFDEPRCLRLVAGCDTVIAVHGCAGKHSAVMLGGLDDVLIAAIAAALVDVGVAVETTAHAYPGRHRQNICNRGRSGTGVQIELTDGIRGGPQEARAVAAIRGELLSFA